MMRAPDDVEVSGLLSADQVDAALAALTDELNRRGWAILSEVR